MKKLKIFIITFLFFSFYAQCLLGGPPRTLMKVYNNRGEIIFVTQNRIRIADSDPPEFTIEIERKSNKLINGHTGLLKPVTKVYEYVIIKDSNNNELMNLRGEELNNTVTIEKDNEDHVIYRLEVN